jgi:hypothetical protein
VDKGCTASVRRVIKLNPIPVHPVLAVFRTANVTCPYSLFTSSGHRSILYFISKVLGNPALAAAAHNAPNPSKKDVAAYLTSFAATRAASARDIKLMTHFHGHTVARNDHRPLARVVIMFGDARFHRSFPRREFRGAADDDRSDENDARARGGAFEKTR